MSRRQRFSKMAVENPRTRQKIQDYYAAEELRRQAKDRGMKLGNCDLQDAIHVGLSALPRSDSEVADLLDELRELTNTLGIPLFVSELHKE